MIKTIALLAVVMTTTAIGAAAQCPDSGCGALGVAQCPDEISCVSAFCAFGSGRLVSCTQSSQQCTCPRGGGRVTIITCSETRCSSGHGGGGQSVVRRVTEDNIPISEPSAPKQQE